MLLLASLFAIYYLMCHTYMQEPAEARKGYQILWNHLTWVLGAKPESSVAGYLMALCERHLLIVLIKS